MEKKLGTTAVCSVQKLMDKLHLVHTGYSSEARTRDMSNTSKESLKWYFSIKKKKNVRPSSNSMEDAFDGYRTNGIKHGQ